MGNYTNTVPAVPSPSSLFRLQPSSLVPEEKPPSSPWLEVHFPPLHFLHSTSDAIPADSSTAFQTPLAPTKIEPSPGAHFPPCLGSSRPASSTFHPPSFSSSADSSEATAMSVGSPQEAIEGLPPASHSLRRQSVHCCCRCCFDSHGPMSIGCS